MSSVSNIYIINNTNNETEKRDWFTIPYIQTITNKCKDITNGLDTSLSYLNKLGTINKVQKDNLPNLSQKNVIYKISMSGKRIDYLKFALRNIKTISAEILLHSQ